MKLLIFSQNNFRNGIYFVKNNETRKITPNKENFMEILKECEDLFPLSELYKTVDNENIKAYETNKNERIRRKRRCISNNED